MYDFDVDPNYTISLTPDYIHMNGSMTNTGTITVNTSDNHYWIELLEKEQVYEEYKVDREIRAQNLGVRAAWEQYKILLELARDIPKKIET
jgi:hypothetical protein